MAQHIHRENTEPIFLASFVAGLTGTPRKQIRYAKNFNADLEVRFMIYTPQQIYSLSNQESDGMCMWHIWETGDMCSLLVGRSEGMKQLGRSWHRWEENSKMDLQEVGWGGMDWMNLVQGRDRWLALVNVVMNRQVSPIMGKFTS